MSLELVTLKYVSIRNVHGDSFDHNDIESESSFKARFGLSIETNDDQEAEDEYRFTVGQRFEAVLPKKNDPFFKIEIAGYFITKHKEKVAPWIESTSGAYDLGSLLFPYLRAHVKPLLEGLGASQIEFPWSTPSIEKVRVSGKAPSTKRKTSKPKP